MAASPARPVAVAWAARGRKLAGFVLGLVAALWLRTLRVRVWVDPRLLAVGAGGSGQGGGSGAGGVGGVSAGAGPWVLSFFHGTQFPLLAWRRRRRTVVMVSHSHDGAMQAVALRCLGFGIVRGSSSRGGVRGLAALIRQVKRGDADAAFAVDGPRGPYGKVKEGAILAARATGGVLVPMGSASARAWVASRAWDRFTLPLPFSRVQIVLGAPLLPDGASEATASGATAALASASATATADELERAIASANATALALLSAKVLEPLPAGEGAAHGDRVGELEIAAVRDAAGDA
ncbi:lysophospholipid acyltransferase family protein [Pendulispora albinea]|uniref:DUF374 domain-containing protein n=1 Tax=Pendulispora albinea TaxID=2741071 RepID=A0ABZ2MCM7_9BACT